LVLLSVPTACPPASAPPRAGAPSSPPPGTSASQAALHEYIDSVVRGQPNYFALTAELAELARANRREQAAIARLGAVREVERAVAPPGAAPEAGLEIFDVTTVHGFAEWRVGLTPEGKLGTLLFREKAKPPALPPSRAELVAQLRQRLEAAAARDDFAGAVMLTQRGEVVFEGAYGLADRERNVPNRVDTKFRLGSVNKVFTMVAVLQLADARKLSLDDSVGKYLPAYPNRELASKVTIGDLVLHRGGTGDIFGAEYDTFRLELVSLEDYVRVYGERPLAFEPGTQTEYSNYGFVLLGLVIAQASGQSYYDYVRDHIYRPAGMVDTDSPPEAAEVPGRSRGYLWGEDDLLHDNVDTLPPRATSAGGGLSTVGDLQRFARALLDGHLLSSTSMTILQSGRRNARGEQTPGLLPIAEYDGRRGFGHGGGAPGMNASLSIILGSDHVVTVLSNLDPPAAAKVHEYIFVNLPRP
jgi:CubicO group peptidase (beta-lactamase class C family)